MLGRQRSSRVERKLTVEKGDELLASPLGAEGESNRRETVDSVQSEEDIVVLKVGR